MIMLNKPKTIINFVKENKNMFTDIAKEYQNVSKANDVGYSILDYEKIIGTITEYITSFCEYNKSGDTRYAGKVMDTTVRFYNNMFTDEDYRKEIEISEFPYVTEKFLELSKKLQELFDELVKSKDKEVLQLLHLSDNQLKKITRVFKDDMKIYKWIAMSGSKVLACPISEDLRRDFVNKSTPVMHATN